MIPGLNIGAVRADTPGCQHVIHFNNAGAALQPQPVVDAQLEYLASEAKIGGYETYDVFAADLDRFYGATAELLGCDPGEVAYTGGASESWWRAFSAIRLEPGDRVLVGRAEFVSGGIGLIQAADRGVVVEVIPDDEHGQTDLEALANIVDGAKLVCLTYLPMSNGLINPASEVGHLAKAAGALYLLDACQAAGQLSLDVDDLQCDFLTATGRKFLRGPRGSGLLYVRQSIFDELLPPTFVDGRAGNWMSADRFELAPTAQRFEFGEAAYAAKRGLAVAIDYATSIGLGAIQMRIAMLAGLMRSHLSEIPGVVVRDMGQRLSGIVTFTVDGFEPTEVSARLRQAGINTSAPGANNSRYFMDHYRIPAVVRAAVHYYNNEDEVAKLVALVGELTHENTEPVNGR